MEKIVKINFDDYDTYEVPDGWEVKMICPNIINPGNETLKTRLYVVLKSIDNPNVILE